MKPQLPEASGLDRDSYLLHLHGQAQDDPGLPTALPWTLMCHSLSLPTKAMKRDLTTPGTGHLWPGGPTLCANIPFPFSQALSRHLNVFHFNPKPSSLETSNSWSMRTKTILPPMKPQQTSHKITLLRPSVAIKCNSSIPLPGFATSRKSLLKHF